MHLLYRKSFVFGICILILMLVLHKRENLSAEAAELPSHAISMVSKDTIGLTETLSKSNLWTFISLVAPTIPSSDQGDSSTKSYTVTLDSCTIKEGEIRSYTTISSAFAGAAVPEGMYPGDLTIEITGQVVIEAGGTLHIGTLSIGSTGEASPVIRGSLGGLIVVKPGGKLKLTDVVLETSSQELLIVQEPGGAVILTMTDLEDSLIQWAPPTVNNLSHSPEDLWLEEGRVLVEELLPTTLKTYLQYQGIEEEKEIPLRWDMSGYDGRTTGEWTLNGYFLDEKGEILTSVRPLTLSVHWYRPEQIVITKTHWSGEMACTAGLTVLSLPEDAEVWGEISTDGGKTWSRWSEFEVSSNDQGDITCIFFFPDNTPRYLRIVAAQPWQEKYWASDGVLMPTEDSDDQSGNRGGSTSVSPPDRKPEQPDSQPTISLHPEDASDQTGGWKWQKGSLSGAQKETESEADLIHETENGQKQDSTPESGNMAPSASPIVSGPLEEMTQAEIPSTIPFFLQILFVAAGLGICVVIGIAVAGIGPFRKKK